MIKKNNKLLGLLSVCFVHIFNPEQINLYAAESKDSRLSAVSTIGHTDAHTLERSLELAVDQLKLMRTSQCTLHNIQRKKIRDLVSQIARQITAPGEQYQIFSQPLSYILSQSTDAAEHDDQASDDLRSELHCGLICQYLNTAITSLGKNVEHLSFVEYAKGMNQLVSIAFSIYGDSLNKETLTTPEPLSAPVGAMSEQGHSSVIACEDEAESTPVAAAPAPATVSTQIAILHCLGTEQYRSKSFNVEGFVENLCSDARYPKPRVVKSIILDQKSKESGSWDDGFSANLLFVVFERECSGRWQPGHSKLPPAVPERFNGMAVLVEIPEGNRTDTWGQLIHNLPTHERYFRYIPLGDIGALYRDTSSQWYKKTYPNNLHYFRLPLEQHNSIS